MILTGEEKTPAAVAAVADTIVPLLTGIVFPCVAAVVVVVVVVVSVEVVSGRKW